MNETIDPWELLREVRDEWLRYHDLYSDGVELDEKLLSRVDTALAARETKQPAQIPTRYRKDTLCPKCEYPKTNPYKCELCSEVWYKGDK